MRNIKPPPLLMGAALLFWGWQSGLLLPGIVMAAVIESARIVHTRWDLSDQDFSRIWTFCALLLLASAVYAFASNEGPSNFTGMFQHPSLRAERNAGISTAKTMAVLIRWLPMIFFLFVGAQTFSSREGVPLQVISLIMRLRWKKARQQGQKLPAAVSVNISYPYFALCLASAAVHTAQDNSYFWGFCLLISWALWGQRPWRYGLAVWAGALGVAIVLGYYGQGSLGHLQRYVETLNPNWFPNFSRRGFDPSHSRTAMGQIGRIKTSSRIVIRLEPKGNSRPPDLLREASYRAYRAEVWYAGNSRNDFENVLAETNNSTWLLLRSKSNTTEVVNVACYLPSGKALLPLPRGTAKLENCPAFLIQKNSAGAVLAEGPGLLFFDGYFGPGETIDSPPDGREDSFVPPREEDGLDQALAEMGLGGRETSVAQARTAINMFFQTKFSYSLWQERRGKRPPGETILNRFLLTNRTGHCEYFASATVLLLRRLGIPARYAVGYSVHEISGKKFIVRQRDAHAWCLVWNKSTGLWEDFDTTPASWVAEEARHASFWQPLSDLWSRIRFEFAKIRWGQTHLRQYILWALVPLLGFLLYQIIFRARRQRLGAADARRAASWPGLDSEFYLLEKMLAQRGLAREIGEPLSRWLQRAASDPRLASISARLKRLLDLHYRYRFDPEGLKARERKDLSSEARECLTVLRP